MKRLTTSQAAGYLGEIGIPVTPGTLSVYRCQGCGPRFYRVRGRIFYDPADLEAFAAGQVVETVDSTEAA